MKKLAFTTLVSAIAYIIVDYTKFKADVIIRHAAGESDYERNHKKR